MESINHIVYAANIDRAAVLALAEGDYQVRLLSNEEAWSGSTLKGAAKKYASTYAKSRRALVARLEAAGYTATIKLDGRRHVMHVA